MTQLPVNEGTLFYKLHSALMFYAGKRLTLVPDDVFSPEDYASLPAEVRLKVRDALHARPDLINAFVKDNPEGFTRKELEIVGSWTRAVVGEFYIFRYLKHQAVFLSSRTPHKAYGVLALADCLEEVVGSRLPILTNTVLLPFKGKIIYDGLLSSYPISFGGGVKASLNEAHKEAKARFGIITSLADGDQPTPKVQKERQPRPRERGRSQAIKRRLEDVMSMILCPVSGCWGLHGAEMAYYYHQDCECHVLEVWPVGIEEPEEETGNGHASERTGILYELAEFEFSDLIKEIPLGHFHFSQQRRVFEIGWKEGGQDLELRVHIEPEPDDEI